MWRHQVHLPVYRMPKPGGPIQERRLLVIKVVPSNAMYEAPIWAEVMDKRTFRTGIEAAYRRFGLFLPSARCLLMWQWRLMPLRREVIDLSNTVQLVDDAMNKW